MIRLEIDCKNDFKEGHFYININLLVADNKYRNIHSFDACLDKVRLKIRTKKIWDSWPGEKPLEIWATGKLSINELFDFRLTDIPGNTYLSVDNPNKNKEHIDTIKLSKETIAIRIWYSHFEWAYDWSAKALFDELKLLHKTNEYSIFNGYEEDLQDEYSAIYFYHKPSEIITLKDLYNTLMPKVDEIHQKALNNLKESFANYPFKAQFVFPDHIKHECEQYLVYFGQFLSDIGIDSHTEISRKGKKILFSVAPKDQNEAIERVSQAFSLFLTIPALHNENIKPVSTGVANQIKFQRMGAAINNLKSQLRLAEATFLAQQDHINSLKEFNTNALVTSLIKVIEKDKESNGVSFFDDLIKIKPYKGKGFEIDIPKVVSKVKEISKKLLK